jgi:hypothetical protein
MKIRIHFLIRTLVCLVVALGATGCNTVSMNRTPYAGVAKFPQNADPAQIQILHQWPDGPFVALGEVTAQPNTDKVKAQKITESIQNEAAKMGANAVVIVSDKNQLVGVSYAGPWFAQMATPIMGTVITGVAIHYTGPPPPAGPVINSQALQWPRYFGTNGYEFAVYQPQISSWPANQISGRFVVAVRPAGTTNETYGVVFFNAQTDVDKANRLVTLQDFNIDKLDFPTHPAGEHQYRTMLTSSLEQSVKTIPLDHLEAILSVSSEMVKARAQQVMNVPPEIFYSTVPSLLVLVDGPPELQDLVGDYQRVINTRSVLLFNKSLETYYLFADNQWFAAPAVAGPWTTTESVLPPDIKKALSAALTTKVVDPMQPAGPDAPVVKRVFVSTKPAELLQTTGSANMLSIPGTSLLYAQNTDNAIFYDIKNSDYYVLISGRWFTASNLHGTWDFVPAGDLPGDFAKIPPDSEKGNVLMSVPGTPQAQQAAIANNIPQTATVQRDQAKLQVNYYGAPNFVPINGTLLSYAANSRTPVIMVGPGEYYAVQGGVWFASTSPQGPWAVATSVPPAIYAIPASSPIHYVTYAYIYGYTPSVVYAGYTPGYMGTVLTADGVVVYGTGYYYPPTIYNGNWIAWPPTYGYGASFALGPTVGFSFGYGGGYAPYWGCYNWAGAYGYGYSHCNVNACNMYTHWGAAVHAGSSYGYNAFTGNQWASRGASSFNPYTDARGVGRSGGAFNAYSGNAAAARSGAYYNPSTGRYAAGQSAAAGNAYNGSYARSSSGAIGNVNNGNSVSWKNGNMMADKDGNMYSYNQSSGLQKFDSSSGSWQSADRSSGSFSSGGGAGNFANNFDRENAGQSSGASRFDDWSHNGGGGWSGFHGGEGGFSGFGGGGGFHGFGGFRR